MYAQGGQMGGASMAVAGGGGYGGGAAGGYQGGFGGVGGGAGLGGGVGGGGGVTGGSVGGGAVGGGGACGGCGGCGGRGGCGGCGGGADSCGVACGSTGGGGAGQLEFVGGGSGSYTTETQYRYVGTGCGEFDYVKPAPNYCVCVVSSSIVLLLLGLLLWFFLKDATNTTTVKPGCNACLAACQYVLNNGCATTLEAGALPVTGLCSMASIVKGCMQCAQLCPTTAPAPAPPSGAAKTCVVWGDPHILTFDNKRVDFYTPGEYWIVKSTTVQIQGKYAATQATSGLAVMKQIAFAGPFMQGNKLIIGTTSAMWNTQPILGGFPSNFQNQLVTAQYNGQGASMQDGREGKTLHIVHLTLPLGVNVQINRWMEPAEGNYINAKITMSAQPEQDGHCGNFNNNPVDDDRLQIRARLGVTGVAAGEMLFPGPKTSVGQSNRPDINNCPRPKLEDAKDKCKEKEHKFIPSMACLIDFCFAGAGFAASAGAEGM